MIVHADLPLLQTSDLAAVAGEVVEGGIVLAPSHDGGTSIAAGDGPPLAFSYGPGSFHRHLALACRRPLRIISSLGTALDLDGPDDLRAAQRHPRGRWLLEELR
jgi:2-phospho-L-lactate guanylyltransferase